MQKSGDLPNLHRFRDAPPHLRSLCHRLIFTMVLLTLQTPVWSAEDLQNWFNDPFVQLSHQVRGCPEPKGPRTALEDKNRQSHHRAERGTSCWLQGVCERPNAFEYDADIARQIQLRWNNHPEFHDSSVWLTVQGRIVYFEGCSHEPGLGTRLEQFAREIPMVLQAIGSIGQDPGLQVPYPVWSGAAAGNK